MKDVTYTIEGENFFFYKSLPIKWVRIVGVVVAIDEYSGRRVYTVDDSSNACIECTILLAQPPKQDDDASKRETEPAQLPEHAPPLALELFTDIDVGSVVDVKGGLSTFRDEKQINIEKMHAVICTAEEVSLWEKRAQFRKDVLDKPWVLGDRDVRRCRKQAERSEEEAERKRKRLKAIIEGQAAKQPVNFTKEIPKELKQDHKRPGSRSKVDLRQARESDAKRKYDALGR